MPRVWVVSNQDLCKGHSLQSLGSIVDCGDGGAVNRVDCYRENDLRGRKGAKEKIKDAKDNKWVELNHFTENSIAKIIVDVAYQIHKTMGPGLLESAYHSFMVNDLQKRGLKIKLKYKSQLFMIKLF